MLGEECPRQWGRHGQQASSLCPVLRGRGGAGCGDVAFQVGLALPPPAEVLDSEQER